MKRFKNILWVADSQGEKSPSFIQAVKLAVHNKSKLTLIDVVEELPLLTKSVVEGTEYENLEQLIQKERQEALDVYLKFLKNKYPLLEVSARCEIGKPILMYTQLVLSKKFDIILKLAGGSSHIKRMTFDSLDLHLVRKCPAAVWIVLPEENKEIETIVVGLSVPQHVKEFDISNKTLELSISMARKNNSRLCFVHACDLHASNVMGRNASHELNSLLKGSHESVMSLVNQYLSHFDLSGVPYTIHLINGRAREVLPEAVKKLSADIIVMGNVVRLVPGVLIGNACESVLLNCKTSVLVVKPEGFLTPIPAATKSISNTGKRQIKYQRNKVHGIFSSNDLRK